MEITLIEDGDEWVGLYVDGVLVDQDHDFSFKTGLDLLNIPFTVRSVKTPVSSLLPYKLSDLSGKLRY